MFLAGIPVPTIVLPHLLLHFTGNASYRYQRRADGEVMEEDFHHWLAGLPEKMRAIMARNGFAASKNSLPLRRHALERRDLSYDAFLQTTLSPEDWAYQQLMAQASAPKEH